MKALAVFILFATSAAVADSDCFKAEQAVYDRVLNDWQGPGEGTRTDVAYAELNLLEARYACSDLTQKSYCEKARAAATLYVVGTLDESRTGLRSQKDIIDSQRVARGVELICRAIPR